MDKHAKMTFRIGEMYSEWAEQVSLYFSAPFDENGPLEEQPSADEKAMHLRDAEAHARMAAFDRAMVAVADGDIALPT